MKWIGSHLILFERTDGGIQVSRVPQQGAETRILNLSVGMNDTGGCVLRDGDDELQAWQVRHRALEATFFGVL